MKKQPVPVFRITISLHELATTIEDLSIAKAGNKLQLDTIAFLSKLLVLNSKNQIGIATPAYTQTGRTGVSAVDMLNVLSGTPVGTPTVIIDRRNQEINRHNYTAEQLSDAEFESANHLALTGEKLPLEHFLPKTIVLEERRHSEVDSSDDSKFSEMFGSKS